MAGYAGEDMEDYEPGPRVAATVLDLLADRPPNLVRMWAVVDLRNWAEDYEQHVAIAERCGRLLARPEARRFVAARLERPDEALRVWGIAESIGLDPWEAGWRHLDGARIDSHLYSGSRAPRLPTAGPGWWPTPSAPAARRAGLGPEDRLLPTGPDGEAAHALAQLVQEMRPGAGRRRSWRPRC